MMAVRFERVERILPEDSLGWFVWRRRKRKKRWWGLAKRCDELRECGGKIDFPEGDSHGNCVSQKWPDAVNVVDNPLFHLFGIWGKIEFSLSFHEGKGVLFIFLRGEHIWVTRKNHSKTTLFGSYFPVCSQDGQGGIVLGQNAVGVPPGKLDKQEKLVSFLPQGGIFDLKAKDTIPSLLLDGENFPPNQVFVEELDPLCVLCSGILGIFQSAEKKEAYVRMTG